MSTLPEITEALSRAVASREFERARSLALQAAARMGGQRGYRIQQAMEIANASEVKLKHWVTVNESRYPWIPKLIAAGMSDWLAEAQNATLLVEHGERVGPLLLCGETRCGKTSRLCAIAGTLGIQTRRLSLSTTMDSYLGETVRKMRNALDEAVSVGRGLWLLDEIEGVFPRRRGDGGAAQERAATVAAALTELDNLPATMMVAATTNSDELLDPAVNARFSVMRFPPWAELTGEEREAFCLSHGDRPLASGRYHSYAEAVSEARRNRVAAIISHAKITRSELEMVE